MHNSKTVIPLVLGTSLVFSFQSIAARLQNIPIVTNKKIIEKFDQNCCINANGEQLIIERLIHDNDFVVDVGCSTGEWSDCVLRYHPKTKILAFEPIPRIAKKTAAHFAHNQNVCVVPCGISKETGSAQFTLYRENKELSSIYPRTKHAREARLTPQIIEIPITTLDSFCTQSNIDQIDFLKIDTEGSELDVLKGSEQLLKLGKISLIQFEYGGTYVDANIHLGDIFKLLEKYHYRMFRICAQGLIPTPWHQSLENYLYANYLAVYENYN